VTTATEQLVITEPGVYDLTNEEYHADPVAGGSLSSSGARALLACPAKFDHQRRHPSPPTRTLDIGTAAHKLVLGVGPDIVVVDADSYRTKAAQQAKKDAHAAGAVPLLPHEFEQVQEMAAAVRAHPIAGPLLDRRAGAAETVLVWRDRRTGIWRRAMIDWLSLVDEHGHLVILDYKTTASAELDAVAKSMAKFGYHQQGPWYADGVVELGLAHSAGFRLIFQEKEAPYLVTVAQPDHAALAVGAARNREALELYARCTTSGYWPGYAEDVVSISLPPWVARGGADWPTDDDETTEDGGW
jgi:hypothetical protein